MHYAFIYHSTPHDYRFYHILNHLFVYVLIETETNERNTSTTPQEEKKEDEKKPRTNR